MSPSKLGTMVAILATAAGFSALAGSAEAQISGTIGGDIVGAPPVPGHPKLRLTNGNVAFRWGYDPFSNLLGTGIDVGGPGFGER